MNAHELQKIAFRVREARALGTALEIGLLDALGREKRTAEELASALGADPRGVRILLDALVAIGVAEHAGEAYALPASVAEAVLPGGTLRALLLHDLWNTPAWSALDQAVRQGGPPDPPPANRYLGDPQILRGFLANYTRAMEQCIPALWDVLAERIAALRPAQVMDLGGGSGSLLRALLERLPHARGRLVEHPFALERARERLAADPVAERIELWPLDFERDELPGGSDAIVLCRVLMGLPPQRARRLIERCSALLPEGGALIVHDFAASSRVGALLSLDMLLHTGGAVPRPAELREQLHLCGLEVSEHASPRLPYMTTWIARAPSRSARRPT